MDVIARLPACAGPSSWCSIRLHPSQNGRCTDDSENSKVRMSRYSNTSTTTQVAQIMVRHWRPGSSWKKSWWSPTCLAYCGKDSLKKVLLENGWEKVPNWEYLFVHRQQGLFLSVHVDDINLAGRNQKSRSHVEEMDDTRWSGRAYVVSWSRVLGIDPKPM